MLIINFLVAFGRYLMLMGRSFSRPERMRMFMKKYVKEMSQLGVDSIGIVLLISFFIGAVICIQMKLNIQSPWMPRWVSGYTTREIMLLEFSSSIMCLILAGKVGSNIASELGTMRVTQQIDALEIMGVNSASYLILPKIMGLITIMPFLVIFSSAMGIVGAYATAYIGHVLPPNDLTLGLQHDFNAWFMWMSIIKSIFFAFIIASVSSYFGYSVEGGSVEVGKASTNAVVSSSVLILFSDVFLTQLFQIFLQARSLRNDDGARIFRNPVQSALVGEHDVRVKAAFGDSQIARQRPNMVCVLPHGIIKRILFAVRVDVNPVQGVRGAGNPPVIVFALKHEHPFFMYHEQVNFGRSAVFRDVNVPEQRELSRDGIAQDSLYQILAAPPLVLRVGRRSRLSSLARRRFLTPFAAAGRRFPVPVTVVPTARTAYFDFAEQENNQRKP